MNVITRTLSILALGSLAMAAQAAPVRYSIFLDLDAGDLNATILAPDFVTSTSQFVPPAASGTWIGKTVVQAGIDLYRQNNRDFFGFNFRFSGSGLASMNGLDPRWLTTPGTYTLDIGTGSTFKTEVVPEPATMAALGLGAVAVLRRRKRA